MNRWLGVGKDYLERYSKRTDNVVFLHIKRTKKPLEEKQEAPAEKVKNTIFSISNFICFIKEGLVANIQCY